MLLVEIQTFFDGPPHSLVMVRDRINTSTNKRIERIHELAANNILPNNHELPNELLAHIFNFLDPKTQFISQGVCGLWRKILTDNNFLKNNPKLTVLNLATKLNEIPKVKHLQRIKSFLDPKFEEPLFSTQSEDRFETHSKECITGGETIKYKRKDKEKDISFETSEGYTSALIRIPLGSGTSKKVTAAFDFKSNGLIAHGSIKILKAKEDVNDESTKDNASSGDANNVETTIEEVKNEIAMQMKFDGDENFVKILYSYLQSDKCIIATEYCNFGTLFELPSQFRTAHILIPLFYKILKGLEKMESVGIIHRDVKPHNIFLHIKPDGTLQPKISDFGFALSIHDPKENIKPAGTPLYCTPEIHETSKLSSKTDLWGFGMVMYETVFSKPLYNALNNAPFANAYHLVYMFLIFLNQDKIDRFFNRHPFSNDFESKIIEFLKYSLVVSPENRPTITQAIQRYRELFNIS